MQIAVTFRHMDTSEALRMYASEKLEHIIHKYLRTAVDANVVLSIEKYWHIATFSLQVRGQMVKSKERSENMYSSIDLALGKLERQLRRYKDKIRSRKPSNVAEQSFSHTVISAPGDLADEDQFDDDFIEQPQVAEEFPGPEEFGFIPVHLPDGNTGPSRYVKVLRSEKYAAEPMDIAEAVMQLNLQDKTFLVFTRTETGTINVIYRRDDSNYGLIET